MFPVPFDRTYSKFLLLMEPFVCFLNFVFVSNFSIFASQRSELTLPQSGAQRQDIFLLVLHRKLMRAPEPQRAPDWDNIHLKNFSAKPAFAQ
jgi:hypothetical protein